MENITATILIIFILQQAELQIIHAQNTSIRFTVSTTEIVGKNHQFWKAAGSDFLFKIIKEVFLIRVRVKNIQDLSMKMKI